MTYSYRAFEASFLRSYGWRFVSFGTCLRCGAPIWWWALRRGGQDMGVRKRRGVSNEGRRHPFDLDKSRSHMATCAERTHTSDGGVRVAPGAPSKDQERGQAGSGRDEPVVRMLVSQAAEQVTGRAERRATPPLSAWVSL